MKKFTILMIALALVFVSCSTTSEEPIATDTTTTTETPATTIQQTDESTTTTEPTICLLYTSPSPRDRPLSRMPSSA